MWEALFSATNLIALLGWVALLVLPRKTYVLSAVLYLGIGLLCLAYTVLLVSLLSGLDAGGGEGGGGFGSIEAVRALFGSDGGVVTGWTHYLAFDLFVGLWISKDADAKGFSRLVQAPILLLTLMAGPAGLIVWLILREARARTMHPRKSPNG